jgi:hypothetical protein
MQKKQSPRWTFDWDSLDPEYWRGPGLSFPVAVELVIAPECNELVIAATDTFPKLQLVDINDVSVHILHPWERGDDAPQPFGMIGESELGLRLIYIEGEERDYVLKLRDGSNGFGYHV